MVQKKSSRYNTDYIYCKSITIRGAILVRIKKKIIAENASFQGYFTEVCFDTSKGNQLSYF